MFGWMFGTIYSPQVYRITLSKKSMQIKCNIQGVMFEFIEKT